MANYFESYSAHKNIKPKNWSTIVMVTVYITAFSVFNGFLYYFNDIPTWVFKVFKFKKDSNTYFQ